MQVVGRTGPGMASAITIQDGVIQAVEPVEYAGDSWLLPGFVDVHCHGGGGADFASADGAEIRAGASFHLGKGTTSLIASLAAMPGDSLCRQLEALAGVIEAGDTTIRGVHLEGPFLSSIRCGVQNPAHLLAPDPALLRRLIEAGRGSVSIVTIAPELEGALELIELARALGVRVAVGHSDATYDQTIAAFDAGATVATHLYNGMRPPHHREPGISAAAIERAAGVELINDGVHLHPAVLRAVSIAAPQRWMLITDAISAAGHPDGQHRLGGRIVDLQGGIARLDPDTLAGSTLTMDAAFRRCVGDCGIPVPAAVTAATQTPAQCVGLDSVGVLAPGYRADLVRMTAAFEIAEVITAASH